MHGILAWAFIHAKAPHLGIGNRHARFPKSKTDTSPKMVSLLLPPITHISFPTRVAVCPARGEKPGDASETSSHAALDPFLVFKAKMSP